MPHGFRAVALPPMRRSEGACVRPLVRRRSTTSTRGPVTVVIAALTLALAPAPATAGGDELCLDGHPAKCVELVAREMQRRLRPLGRSCDHDAVFALLYLRVTEAVAEALDDGGLFDLADYIADMDLLFAAAYFGPFDDFHAGRHRRIAPAWRVAFEAAEQRQVVGATDMLLGINAHVRNDLPFIVERLGREVDGRDAKPDFDRVNRVLREVYPRALAEAARRLDPSIDDGDIPGLSGDDDALFQYIVAIREDAWRRGVALLEAPDRRTRDLLAAEIRQDAFAHALALRDLGRYETRPTDDPDARYAYCQANWR